MYLMSTTPVLTAIPINVWVKHTSMVSWATTGGYLPVSKYFFTNPPGNEILTGPAMSLHHFTYLCFILQGIPVS